MIVQNSINEKIAITIFVRAGKISAWALVTDQIFYKSMMLIHVFLFELKFE
jgi:hypothetical protein